MKLKHKLSSLIYWLLVFTTLFYFITTTPAVIAQDDEDEKVLFQQGNEKYVVKVRAGQIGIWLKDRSEQGQKDVLERLDKELVQTMSNGALILSTGGAEKRAELAQLAREIVYEFNDIISLAGFVIEFEDSESPLIVTDQFIMKLKKNADELQLDNLNKKNNVDVVMSNPFDKQEFLLRVKAGPHDDPLRSDNVPQDALGIANYYNGKDYIEYAHPNFIRVVESLQAEFNPNDPLYANQWHLNNTGQNGGTIDADIDANLAWGITRGDPNVVIAIIDNGFEINHPDLLPNLWHNPNEIENNADDDGDGLVDDIHGWDFTGCCTMSSGDTDPNCTMPCGDDDPNPDSNNIHGTPVAGAAIARGNNGIGVSGSCPECKFMPIRANMGVAPWEQGLAFDYARVKGADIISNSWSYPIGTATTLNIVNKINTAADSSPGGADILVFFAIYNNAGNFCELTATGEPQHIFALDNVIAVSRANNQDRFDPGGYGNCLDLLGPSASNNTLSGTLWAVTTDRSGTIGYNDSGPSTSFPCPVTDPTDALDYTFCFSGTSFATPVVAGSAGLILSVSPNLTRLQIQRLLQDTADKIEDSIAAYDSETGFSAPANDPFSGLTSGVSTHGYGRVNAFEAVRVAADQSLGGRGGVDIMIRDNRLDWGNTEQPSNVLLESTRSSIPHWQSADIKVDAPPFVPTIPMTSLEFVAFNHEEPIAGSVNRVYVRVRNRGPVAADTVQVKLHWAYAGTGLPTLPIDFWTAFPGDSTDTSVWHPLGVQTINNLAYSGASVANSGEDNARIVTFNFSAPEFDENLPNPDHYCLFAVINSPQDLISAANQTFSPSTQSLFIPDWITPRDNNVTHRNVSLHRSNSGTLSTLRFFVRNPFSYPILTELDVIVPRSWQYTLEPDVLGENIEFKSGQEELVSLVVNIPRLASQKGAVEIIQNFFDSEKNKWEMLGGMTYKFSPSKNEL